ncbi:hypothetical protein V2J09_020860 [Rumex salicifolius]
MLSKHMLSHLLLTMRLSSSAEIQSLKPGSILRQTRIFTKADVIEYSKVSHDYNPVHLDPECARNAGFEDCIVHGMLVASLFPRIIASQFPGAVYATQSLHFKLPIHVGEEIVGEVKATNIRQIKKKYLVKFSTKCFKNDSIMALEGEATAILPTLSMDFSLPFIGKNWIMTLVTKWTIYKASE